MRLKLIVIARCSLLVLLCISMLTSIGQNTEIDSLNIGDNAPPLKLGTWLKGAPIQSFEKDKLYVLEFWATWCKPCKAAMPKLSELANQYRGKISILGIDIYETNQTPPEKIKKFVDSMGILMDYSVAVDKDKFMETFWVVASGNQSIPKTIIINADGKVAWIGHPKKLEQVISKVVDNTWDIKEARNKWMVNKYIKSLDDSMNYALMNFTGNCEAVAEGLMIVGKEDPGKPDSALFYINKIIEQKPELQYQPNIVFNTFYSLLKIDLPKALAYGKKVLTITNNPDTDGLNWSIIGAVERCSNTIPLPAAIYELGAEAYRAEINQFYYPELANVPKYYHKMALWYWLAKNKEKAIEAEQTAVDIQKSRGGSPSQMAVYKAQLQLYKTSKVHE